MIVVDTNLIVYLLLRGPGLETAESVFRKDGEWCAPLLWRSEFRNVLAGHIRRHLISLHDAEGVAAHAENLMAGREHAVASHDVLRLVAQSKCSAYDCEFVALAAQLRVPLVTSDGEILDHFPAHSFSPSAFVGGV